MAGSNNQAILEVLEATNMDKISAIKIFLRSNFKKSDFVLQIDRQDKSLGLFQTFLKSKSPRCNLLTNQQYKLLYYNALKQFCLLKLC